jgi:Ca2+/Na+ antiporter
VITGLAAIIANNLRIEMFAVKRDTVYYLAAIGYLTVIFLDGHVNLIEAIVGLIAYVFYVVLLVVWKNPNRPVRKPVAEAVSEPPTYPAFTNNVFRRVQNLIIRGIKLITGAPNENYIWTFFVAIVFIVCLSSTLYSQAA